ncbi:MAG: hypothetical protein P4L45_13650 [Ignavibacteriaceae bacterium]|nr:hypothetical protein [Ignavibacteriaceae bacterium]
MQVSFEKESVYKNLKKGQVFEFSNGDNTLILSGYSDWKAFISSHNSNVWVEVQPKININKQLIYLPKTNSSSATSREKINQPELEKRKREFFNTIPAEVVNILKCYSDSHWEIVRAIKYVSDDLIRLISANPALAYILVHLEKFNPSYGCYYDMELLKTMILKKQREILRISSFPGSDRIVKAIMKLNPVDLSIKTLIKLKQALSDKTELSDRILNLLSFSDQINENLLNLFAENKNLVQNLSNKLIFEMTKSNDYRNCISLLQDIEADCSVNKLKFPEISSITDLPAIREKINHKAEILRQFPEPPIKGNAFVQPLTSEKELISWSKRQGNCIRHFGNSVRSGRIYMYKIVNDTEEATQEIKIVKNRLKMGSLLGTYNRNVSTNLKEVVGKWFSESKYAKQV